MSLMARNSYEGHEMADLTSIIAEFPEGDEMPGLMIPVIKLSGAFDNCVKEREDQMKVYLRIRPTPSQTSTESTIFVESDHTIITNAPDSSTRAQYTKLEERKYAFTKVFPVTSKESEVYETVMLPLLHHFFNGENCLLFLYGIINSGKTYTMQGSGSNPGLLPNLVNSILEYLRKKNLNSDLKSSSSSLDLQISILEIYQEKIYDLLNDKKDKEKSIIRDNVSGVTEVSKLSIHSVGVYDDFLKLLVSSSARRTNAITGCNVGSNRSHVVYVFTMKQKNKKPAVFHLVELAGTEKSNRSKSTIQQQKESDNINVSLMHLWRCLQGLKNKNNETSIPLRESKLTHLLLPSLIQSGLRNVAMIACVSGCTDDYDTTLSILANASLGNKIKENSNEKEKEKEKKKESKSHRVTKFLTSAAKALLTAAALGKRRRAEHDNILPHSNPISIPIHNNDQKNVNTNKRINIDINTNIDSIDKSIMTKTSHLEKQKIEAIDEIKILESPNQNYLVTKLACNIHDKKLNDDNFEIESNDSSVVKKMRIEISRLQGENEELLNEQLTRETEIRVEVSEEMALRSRHLLDQLQDLQRQLDEQEKKSGRNVKSTKKACKNIRKDQIEKENEEMSKDLEEAEEELERVKLDYENKINELMKEKNILADELVGLKAFNEGQNDIKILSEVLDVLKSSPPRVHTNDIPIILQIPLQVQDPLLIQNFKMTSKPTEIQLNSYQKFLSCSSGFSPKYSPKQSKSPMREPLPHWTEGKEDLISPFTEEKFLRTDSPRNVPEEKFHVNVLAQNLVEKIKEKEESFVPTIVPVNSYSNFISNTSFMVPSKEIPEIPSAACAIHRPSSISLLRAKIRDENDPRNSVRIEVPKRSVADKFSDRMQRDPRFKKKITEHAISSSSSVGEGNMGHIIKRSVVRSPLSPVREDVNSAKGQEFIWDKTLKGASCGPPVQVEISWEQSLRGTDRDRPLSPNRFTTTAERSVSPLTRLGRTVDIQQSQLVDSPKNSPQPLKAPLPCRAQQGTILSQLDYQTRQNVQQQYVQNTLLPLADPMTAGNIKLAFAVPKNELLHPGDGDRAITSRARAKIVSARRVISTRMTHKEPTTVEFGSNPNAGDYISRLRAKNVR